MNQTSIVMMAGCLLLANQKKMGTRDQKSRTVRSDESKGFDHLDSKMIIRGSMQKMSGGRHDQPPPLDFV